MNYTAVADNILAKDDNTSETSEAGDEEYENLNNLENASIKDDKIGTMSGELGATPNADELGANPESTSDDFLSPPTSNPIPTPNLGGKTRKKKTSKKKTAKNRKGRQTVKKTKKKGKNVKTRKNKKKQTGGLNRIGTGIGSNCYDPNYSIYNTNLPKLFPYKP